MLLDLVMIIVGTFFVLKGADVFTDGACAIARRWGVSELIIGLTVVAMGTSLPELAVSLFSAIRGSADMSVGNVVGSNIFNSLVIVGASAMALPIVVDRSILRHELPMCLLATLALLACGATGDIARWKALLLLALFALFILFSVRKGLQEHQAAEQRTNDVQLWKVLGMIVLGIAALVAGGQLLVSGASDVARQAGVSEAVIGLTILAGGTSLPELATSVVAARKGASGLALGNAIGSNLFNITFVLGVSASISPMQITGDITLVDWLTLLFSLLLLWLMAATGRILQRLEGFILLMAYAAYLAWLLINA